MFNKSLPNKKHNQNFWFCGFEIFYIKKNQTSTQLGKEKGLFLFLHYRNMPFHFQTASIFFFLNWKSAQENRNVFSNIAISIFKEWYNTSL